MSITMEGYPVRHQYVIIFIIYLNTSESGKWLNFPFIAFMFVCLVPPFRHNGLPLVILVLLVSVISLPVCKNA